MKAMHTIAIAAFSAMSLGAMTSAHAQTPGAGHGMMGRMMQGEGATAGAHMGMAGHPGHGGGQPGAMGPKPHAAAGAGPTAGGCPMTSSMSHDAPAAAQK